MRLAGRSVLVTGALGGIGPCLVARLVDEGAEWNGGGVTLAGFGPWLACSNPTPKTRRDPFLVRVSMGDASRHGNR